MTTEVYRTLELTSSLALLFLTSQNGKDEFFRSRDYGAKWQNVILKEFCEQKRILFLQHHLNAIQEVAKYNGKKRIQCRTYVGI